MGSDDHIGEGEESGCGGMLQNLIGTVLKYIGSLFLINVKSYREELSGADSLNQIVGIYQAAS